MLTKTKGIVFRAIKYGDTSLICDIYTLDLGLRSYIFSGVRKSRTRVSAGLLQPMSLLDLVVYNKEGKDLNRVKEIKVLHPYQQLPYDVRRSSVGLFLIEVARKSIREAHTNPALFRYLLERFILLDTLDTGLGHFHLHTMVGLTRFLGFMPGGTFEPESSTFDLREGLFLRSGYIDPLYRMDIPESEALFQLLGLPDESISDYHIKVEIRDRLLEKLIKYYTYHVERFGELKSLEVLRAVLH
ncbi:MAG: DNA repair protein RecO [Bacteroidota bacterium]